MTFQDVVNGSFELLGGVMNAFNIWQLYKHKEVKGVHWLPTAVFTLWGYWNLYYYPHLSQWMSFAGGIGIVATNFVWLCLAIYYLYLARQQVHLDISDVINKITPTDTPLLRKVVDSTEPPCWPYGWYE